MKKIVITNAYTWYNKGDAGILLGIVETLKKYYKKDLEINILSFTPEEDKKRYCLDPVIKNVYSNVLNPHPYKHTKIGKIKAIFKLFFSMIYQFLMINLNKKILINHKENYKALSEADYIVVCGGGFLGGKKFDSLMHVFQIYVNTKFNKKVIMMGTSIEPMKNKFIKRKTEKALKKLDHIYAREIITFNYCKKFIKESQLTLIPDMAFMLKDDKSENKYISKLKEKYPKIYGLTVRKWNFPGYNNPVELQKKYIQVMADFIENKVKEDNSLFIFVPQVIVKYGYDAETAKAIKQMISNEYQDNFKIIEDDLSPEQIKNLIWNMDFFIGTRMHSNIFATSMGIPTIAVAYEKKTNGIMHTVNLDDYVIEMSSITKEQLDEKTEQQMLNDEKIRNDLKERIVEIRKEIFEKISLILKEM